MLALIMLVVFGKFTVWSGDGAWGPRFLVPLLPFALLPALPVLQRVLRGSAWRKDGSRDQGSAVAPHRSRVMRDSPLARVALAAVFTAGAFINLLGVLVNFDTYLNVGYSGNERHFQPYASPVVGHLGLLNTQLRGALLRLFPRSGTAYIKEGFSYSEGDKSRGNLLPRWTYGQGELEIREERVPLSVTLRLADHRPPELPRATVSILVDGTPVQIERRPVEGRPASSDYIFTLPDSPSTVVIKSDTWNPADLAGGGRDENLGVSLEQVRGGDPTLAPGTQYTIVEATSAPDYYPAPLWYYDLRTGFAADLWPVYLAEARMGQKGLLLLALPLVLLSAACLIVGLRGVFRSMKYEV
jgi:hypothetical protein